MSSTTRTQLIAGFLGAYALIACDYKEEPISINQVITSVISKPANPVADGTGLVQITVSLPAGTADSKRNITLQTDVGTFLESGKNSVTVPAILANTSDGALTAYANLVSPAMPTTANVQITAQSYAKVHPIIFGIAHPEKFTLSTDRLVLTTAPNMEAMLTIALQRNIGTPTAGQSVTLISANNVGMFRNKTVVSDALGKCVNYFSIPDTTFWNKRLTLTARVKDSNGAFLPDQTVDLTIKKP